MLDGDGIGVDPEIARRRIEVAERVPRPAADVEHRRTRRPDEKIVERPHVDPADDARTNLVVDERMTEDLFVEGEHRLDRQRASP